ncbi:HNH endonuclease signature motif containing protein [Microbacterium aureliae]
MTKTAANPADVAAERLRPVVDRLVDVRARIASLQAAEAQLFAQAGVIAADWAAAADTRSDAELAHRSVAADIAAALRVSDRTVQRQIGDAERMVTRFPETARLLRAGRISLAHARIIVEAGARIAEPELRAEYEASVLPYAQAESASRLRPVARRRAQWFLNETVRERHAAAALTRTVQVHDLDDGMSVLQVTTASVVVHGIHDRATRMARDVAAADAEALRAARTAATDAERVAKQAGTDAAHREAVRLREHADQLAASRRSMDQIRADLIADMLLATDPTAHIGTTPTGLAAIRATVQVTVPALALIDSPLDDPFDAITLAGYGPISPDTARQLAAGAPGWDRILTHPISGAVLAVDRHDPTAQMRRHLAVRDQHCRFPGCRLATARSDIDHTVDWAHGGPTEIGNLAHLCRRHHTLKHHTPWTVKQKPGGILEWTSPTGSRYPSHPTSAVHFATDAEFDPAPF